MSQTTIVKCKVEELSKYGFKANGKYVNYSKQITEEDKAKVVPGAEFEAEYYVADSGKEYLNKVLSVKYTDGSMVSTRPLAIAPVVLRQEATAVGPAITVTKVDTERAKKFTPKFTKAAAVDNTMSKAEWSAKDRSQLIGGLSHDAAAITAAMIATSVMGQAEAVLAYKQILVQMLSIREEVK